jgi:hypothetical protein
MDPVSAPTSTFSQTTLFFLGVMGCSGSSFFLPLDLHLLVASSRLGLLEP